MSNLDIYGSVGNHVLYYFSNDRMFIILYIFNVFVYNSRHFLFSAEKDRKETVSRMHPIIH